MERSDFEMSFHRRTGERGETGRLNVFSAHPKGSHSGAPSKVDDRLFINPTEMNEQLFLNFKFQGAASHRQVPSGQFFKK